MKKILTSISVIMFLSLTALAQADENNSPEPSTIDVSPNVDRSPGIDPNPTIDQSVSEPSKNDNAPAQSTTDPEPSQSLPDPDPNDPQ